MDIALGQIPRFHFISDMYRILNGSDMIGGTRYNSKKLGLSPVLGTINSA
jgi:hypothetical protein